jgi:hypothetical protein
VRRGVPLLVCQVRCSFGFYAIAFLLTFLFIPQSFSKNAGLYGERVGALHVVSSTVESAARVKSQLGLIQRSEIGNPPSHGVRLVRAESVRPFTCVFFQQFIVQVTLILNNPVLFEEWKRDVKTMTQRIKDMRHELYDLLTKELKTPGNWDHIINQIGMFSYVPFPSIFALLWFAFGRLIVLSAVSVVLIRVKVRRWWTNHTYT